MPTNRILYTLEDLKCLVAEKHGLDSSDVHVFENRNLSLCDDCGTYEMTDRTYILQVDE